MSESKKRRTFDGLKQQSIRQSNFTVILANGACIRVKAYDADGAIGLLDPSSPVPVVAVVRGHSDNLVVNPSFNN